MVLSDRTIKEELAKERIVIDPLEKSFIQPASVDVRLDRQIMKFLPPEDYSYIDIRSDLKDLTILDEIPDPLPYILEPGGFILASTLERVELPDDVVARLEGKSSLGRLGLLIHSTAGYIDPGWKGQLTLEISNVAPVRISLYYQMKIGQISFLRLSTPADRLYGSDELGSKYQGQMGPTPSRSRLDFGGKPPRAYPSDKTSLSGWLEASEYEGSVSRLAHVLGVNEKTVQEWVYGRNDPGPQNRALLYRLTRLPDYAPGVVPHQPDFQEPDAEQPPLLAPEET